MRWWSLMAWSGFKMVILALQLCKLCNHFVILLDLCVESLSHWNCLILFDRRWGKWNKLWNRLWLIPSVLVNPKWSERETLNQLPSEMRLIRRAVNIRICFIAIPWVLCVQPTLRVFFLLLEAIWLWIRVIFRILSVLLSFLLLAYIGIDDFLVDSLDFIDSLSPSFTLNFGLSDYFLDFLSCSL